MSCITVDFRKPETFEYDLQDTLSLHADRLLQQAVAAFMADPQNLLEHLNRLLETTNRARWDAVLSDLPDTPEGRTLRQRIEALYQSYERDPLRLGKVRGVLFEAIVFQLVRRRYAVRYSYCEHNIRIGFRGNPRTRHTIDVAAWRRYQHESEFYECKLYVDRNVPAVAELEAIHEARRQYLTSTPPHSSIAAVYTLTDQQMIDRVLIPASYRDGGLREHRETYPEIDFKNLSELVFWETL